MFFHRSLISNNFKNVSFYKMVDIGYKKYVARRACVEGCIYVGKKVFNLIKRNSIPKGDPLLLAEVAAINSVKNTSNFILLCHHINIDNVFINSFLDESNYSISLY